MVSTAYLIVVVSLMLVFAVSFTFFVRRMFINSSMRNSGPNEVERKLDTIIEQNIKIISLLERKG